jgi:hypothetical protein
MALGQILAGNFINAVDLADEIAALTARVPIRARSTVATTFVSSTTFGNITGLSCAVAANSVYKFRGRLKVTGANATHDLKLQMTLPAGASLEWSAYNGTAAAVTSAINSIDTGSTSGTHIRGTFLGTLTIPVEGFITTAGTAGTAQLQGAQNVSDAGTLSFDAGSEISLELWV